MAEGTVLWFNSEKGEGAIRPDSAPFSSSPSRRRGWWRKNRDEPTPSVEATEIYVHYSAIQMMGYRTLDPGQRVSFLVEQGRNGPVATKVTPLG